MGQLDIPPDVSTCAVWGDHSGPLAVVVVRSSGMLERLPVKYLGWESCIFAIRCWTPPPQTLRIRSG